MARWSFVAFIVDIFAAISSALKIKLKFKEMLLIFLSYPWIQLLLYSIPIHYFTFESALNNVLQIDLMARDGQTITNMYLVQVNVQNSSI